MREFSDVLRDINGGRFAEELTEALADLVASTASTGKSGTITVSLKLKPGNGAGKIMTVEHDVKVKSPDFDRPTEYMFIAGGNTLVRDNPEQKKLDLRDVTPRKASATEVIDIDDETGEIVNAAAAV